MIDANQHLTECILQMIQNIKPIQKTMIGHGLLIMFVALATGLLLWVSLLGGFEIYPGFILSMDLGGSPEGWARVHRGVLMNALMILVFAFVLISLNFSSKKENILGWIFIATGWANTIFYIAANYSGNRGLSFGENKFGASDIFSFIALMPAYVFGVLSMVVIFQMAIHCLKKS
ncbi:MAG: hypothetical protein RL604_498 [Pseudomonadota bacterium]|jgi:styrene-oxide isomerase